MGNREAAGVSTAVNGQLAGAEGGGDSLIDLSEHDGASSKINSQLSALCEYSLFSYFLLTYMRNYLVSLS